MTGIQVFRSTGVQEGLLTNRQFCEFVLNGRKYAIGSLFVRLFFQLPTSEERDVYLLPNLLLLSRTFMSFSLPGEQAAAGEPVFTDIRSICGLSHSVAPHRCDAAFVWRDRQCGAAYGTPVEEPGRRSGCSLRADSPVPAVRIRRQPGPIDPGCNPDKRSISYAVCSCSLSSPRTSSGLDDADKELDEQHLCSTKTTAGPGCEAPSRQHRGHPARRPRIWYGCPDPSLPGTSLAFLLTRPQEPQPDMVPRRGPASAFSPSEKRKASLHFRCAPTGTGRPTDPTRLRLESGQTGHGTMVSTDRPPCRFPVALALCHSMLDRRDVSRLQRARLSPGNNSHPTYRSGKPPIVRDLPRLRLAVKRRRMGNQEQPQKTSRPSRQTAAQLFPNRMALPEKVVNYRISHSLQD